MSDPERRCLDCPIVKNGGMFTKPCLVCWNSAIERELSLRIIRLEQELKQLRVAGVKNVT